ncbi:MAG: sugar ABC transporter permease [Lachnospiraceae bacterium]|nr:sugar ABC transporter permease [Lachnospiraceae bacterium]
MSNQSISINKNQVTRFLKRLYRCRMLYLMILPSIITVFIFHYIPLYGVQIAFKDFRSSLGIWGSEWVGLKHFKTFFNYPYFGRVIWNTLWISLCSLLTFPLPVIFSLMLNEMRNEKLKKVCQMITYAPHFVSTVVVCSMIILFTNREGLINIILGFFGVEAIDFMGLSSAFAPIYSISGLWSGLGWSTIIYMATLSGVSQELIEAAKIDGATRMQVIWYVNLPHIKGTVITMFILNMGSLLSVGFEKTFLLQNSLNQDASSVIATYVYEIGLLNQQFSYSTAIGLFNSIVNIIMIVAANTISKKLAHTGLW